MSDTTAQLACPHCRGTNLIEETVQPVSYAVQFHVGADGRLQSTSRQLRWIVDFLLKPTELRCDDCDITLDFAELTAAP